MSSSRSWLLVVAALGAVSVLAVALAIVVHGGDPGAGPERVRRSDRSATSGVPARDAWANGDSRAAVISADGRFVAFESDADNLVAGDTNADTDVFVRDRASATVARVSVAGNGAQGIGEVLSTSDAPSISADGRFIAFASEAANLVPGDSNDDTDVFVRDQVNRDIERASLDTRGRELEGMSYAPSLSVDGRFIAFASLVPGGASAVFVRDRTRASTEFVRAGSHPAVTADGRFLAFESEGLEDVPGGGSGVFLYDRVRATTVFVAAGTDPALSGDGRVVAYGAEATHSESNDVDGRWDVFARDRVTGETELVSVGSDGGRGNDSSYEASLSPDGRFVAFSSDASNLVAGDRNGRLDVFVRDRASGTTELVSVGAAGAPANGDSGSPSVSGDGRLVAFSSDARNLVAGDRNGKTDVFVRDRVTGATERVSVAATLPRLGPVVFEPAQPTAGKTLTVTTPVTEKGTAVVSAEVQCEASVGRRPIRVTSSVVLSGRARCTLSLLTGSAGKTLRGRIRVTTRNGAVATTFQGHVGIGEWRITDLGTLGWKDEQTEAVAINERGQIAGNRYVVVSVSETQTTTVGGAFVWENGTMRALRSLGGVERAWPPRLPGEAVALNDRGDVLGWSGNHAVVWKGGAITDLGAASGGTWTLPVGIDARGEVALNGDTDNGRERAFLWRAGRLTDLGTLGGERSTGTAINDRGEIVGWSDRSCVVGADGLLESCSSAPFLWKRGAMVDLGTFGGQADGGETAAVALNDDGEVVGSSYLRAAATGEQREHAFLWRDGIMTDLSAGDAAETRAVAINERGDVVGVAATASGADHAVLWRSGTMIDLGTLAAGDAGSEAWDLNDDGVVVGSSVTLEGTHPRECCTEHAFVWRGGVMTDLGTLPGDDSSGAVAINERGQIVGWSEASGKRRAVLWTPVRH